jgi:predicted short-subunit dehydrogenase-like oxidoreductase (DUF2520 family)
MKVEIIGAGRLGRSLAALLQDTPHEAHLSGRERRDLHVDLRVIAVPDSSIQSVAESLPHGPPVLHCSGCLDEDVLAPHEERGTFHPLMTFPGPEIRLPNLTGVSATISGAPKALALAAELATALGMTPVHLRGDRRLYHAAAVIAGNFSTLMLCEAAAVLARTGIDYERAKQMLGPLAQASIMHAQGSAQAMTGPASRGDLEILEAHRAAFEAHDLSAVQHLYDILSDRILLQASGAKSSN